VKISFCLIVKNEEKHLRKCLNSILPIADEIVICDTGSTDGTIDILNEYSEKYKGIFNIFYELWQNDFSYHRNRVADEAKNDLVAFVDADEELTLKTDTKNEVLKLLKSYDLVQVKANDIQKGKIAMTFLRPLFYNRKVYRFAGIVHNKLNYFGKKQKPETSYTGIELTHYGYDLTPEQIERKKDRTLPLLLRRLDNIEDKEVLFYLCQMYFTVGDKDKGYYFGLRYANEGDDIKLKYTTIYTLCDKYLEDKQPDKADELLSRFIDENISLDLYYMLLRIGITLQNKEYIRKGANSFIYRYQEYTNDISLLSKSFSFTFNINNLVFCYFYLSVVNSMDYKNNWRQVKDNYENLDSEFKGFLSAQINYYQEKNILFI